ncbi:MAG: hypothetical protein K2X11_22755 [Acetobacteraceae bacterium]|nr:hypothetical protein [Acetobacteraceae bacterium]
MIARGVAYGLTAFLLGALFGPLREVVLAPRFGPALAVAIELPVVLAACWWLAGSLAAPLLGPRPRIGMGLVGLAMLVALDLALALALRGWRVADWLAHFGTARGALTLLGYGAFASFPLMRR